MYRILLLILLFSACQGTDTGKEKAQVSGDLLFRSVDDMNDAYFELKEDGHFSYYRLLFDSVKNSMLSGNWTRENDTILLHFEQPDGPVLLGSRALVNTEKNEIRFIDDRPETKLMITQPPSRQP